jgi:hypothetical protein
MQKMRIRFDVNEVGLAVEYVGVDGHWLLFDVLKGETDERVWLQIASALGWKASKLKQGDEYLLEKED